MNESQMELKLRKMKQSVSKLANEPATATATTTEPATATDSSTETGVTKIEAKDSKTRMPLTDDATLKAIMYTNAKYQKQMDRRLLHKPAQTIVMTTQSFAEFVNNDIQQIQHLNWLQIPITHKYKFVIDFIENDESLNSDEKEQYKSKTSPELVSKKGLVKYDKKNGIISSLNYDLLTGISM